MENRSPRVCEGCQRTYRPSSSDQRFCNRLCGTKYKRPPTPASAITEPRFLDGPDRAACLGVDPEMFFPGSDDVVPPDAAAVCDRCVLFARCEAWSLEQPAHLLHGIWAGKNRAQRRRLVSRAS